MTKPCATSELVAAFREGLVKYETSGVVLTAPAIKTLCKTLLTIQEVARDFEEDYRLLEGLLAGKFEDRCNRADCTVPNPVAANNIVRLKPGKRIIPLNGDGGDAA